MDKLATTEEFLMNLTHLPPMLEQLSAILHARIRNMSTLTRIFEYTLEQK